MHKGVRGIICNLFRLICSSQDSHAPKVPSFILNRASSINRSSLRSRLVSWKSISLPSRLEARSISLLKVRSPTSLSKDFEDWINFNKSLRFANNRSLIFRVSGPSLGSARSFFFGLFLAASVLVLSIEVGFFLGAAFFCATLVFFAAEVFFVVFFLVQFSIDL